VLGQEGENNTSARNEKRGTYEEKEHDWPKCGRKEGGGEVKLRLSKTRK